MRVPFSGLASRSWRKSCDSCDRLLYPDASFVYFALSFIFFRSYSRGVLRMVVYFCFPLFHSVGLRFLICRWWEYAWALSSML